MKIVDITIIKPNTSINVKGECNHKHMQIVALNGSTAAINEAHRSNKIDSYKIH